MGEFGTETGQDPLPLEWGGGDGLMRDPLVAMHEWRWLLVPQRQGEVLFLIPRG